MLTYKSTYKTNCHNETSTTTLLNAEAKGDVKDWEERHTEGKSFTGCGDVGIGLAMSMSYVE